MRKWRRDGGVGVTEAGSEGSGRAMKAGNEGGGRKYVRERERKIR